jgi:putative membrane protein
MRFTESERQEIADAIRAAEAMTGGEIFCVHARASDDYRHIPLLWAALVALILPAPLIPFARWPVETVYLAQLAAFAALALACSWPPLRIRLVPGSVKRRRAHRHALEQFLAHGLHTTQSRTGVLIFVSQAERYAEVVADEAIFRKVEPAVWDEAVAALVAAARAGRPAKGFVQAIAICAEVLARHFPPAKDDRNELPDRLVEL